MRDKSLDQMIAEFVERHEGRRYQPYRCPAGAMTIGVGWNMSANSMPKHIEDYLKIHGRITDEMVDELLNISLDIATGDCIRLFPEWETFSENRKMALVDFLFQLGLTKAKKFKRTIDAINAKKWSDAAEYMRQSLWAKQTPKRANEVIEMIEVG